MHFFWCKSLIDFVSPFHFQLSLFLLNHDFVLAKESRKKVTMMLCQEQDILEAVECLAGI